MTPENVYVEYELGGLGSRFAALFIDTLIQGALMAIVIIIMLFGGLTEWIARYAGGIIAIPGGMYQYRYDYNSAVIAAGFILIFLISFGYFIFFEAFSNGQTPGKKIMGLRVVKENGEPISFLDSVIRNLLRIADMLPALNILGAFLILFTKNCKRAGDYGAGTIVIKVRKSEQALPYGNLGLNDISSVLTNVSTVNNAARNISTVNDTVGEVNGTIEDGNIPDGKDGLKQENIYPVTNEEYNILKEFLSRRGKLGEREYLFVYHLNRYFMKKFNIETPFKNPYQFFEDIVRMNSDV